MARIEITGSPDELERISTFLNNNNIKFRIVKDFGNHSLKDSQKFNELIEKFK